jgi:hypothetical protein
VGVVTVPVAPPVFIERQTLEPGAGAPATSDGTNRTMLEPGFWYYCRDPAGYYPSVAECPQGWVKVPPRPATAL